MRITCALLLSCAVAGCASKGSEAAERVTDTTARRDSIAAVAASSLSESNVVSLLEQTHAADSALGALGAAQGTSTNVKEFGRMILREHHALHKDAADVAQQLGITPEPASVAPDDAPAADRERVNAGKPGVGWDRDYIDYALAMHQAAMENTARALAATNRAEIKQFIDKSVPILQKHIDKARSLRKSLPKMQDTTAK